MKKMLAILGSPRKNGNTSILLDRIMKGAGKNGVSSEMITLCDMTIKECDGCHACWKKNACSKNDDMIRLYEKISQSDILLFGTPVYWYGPTALMKCFIDRFVYFNSPENRKHVKGKMAVIAVPFEENDLSTAAPVTDFFEKSLAYLGIKLLDRLIVPGVTKKDDASGNERIMELAYNVGLKIS
jgi:multimeric flavodoxin WrbA